MTGASIAAEVATALSEVAADVGSGAFSATLVRTTQGSTPWDATAPSETEFELAAVVQYYPKGLIDGTLIQMGDRKVMVEATGEVPTVKDTLRMSGEDYAIIAVREVSPSGVPLYYEVQVRR